MTQPLSVPSAAPRGRDAAIRSLVWTLLESVGLSGLGLLTLVIVSRYLGPEAFGLASLALAVIQLVIVLVERLFHDALIQRPALAPRDAASAFSATLALGALLTLCTVLLAPVLALQVGKPGLESLLVWMSISILATGAGSVLGALHRREMAFRALALRSLFARACGSGIAIGLALWGAGVWSLVAQQVLAAVLATLALWWWSAVPRPGLAWDGQALRQLLRLGLPSMAQQFVWMANARLFIVLAGARLNIEVLGQIALALRAVDMVRDVLGQAVGQLALPLFSRVEREGGDRRAAYVAAVRLTTAVMFPVFSLLALLAPEVVALAFGAQWLPAAPYVSVLALLAFHFFARLFVTPMLAALGNPLPTLAGSLGQLSFVAALMLTLQQPTPAAVLAIWSARLAISTPIDMWFLKRLAGIGYRDQWRGAFSPALACAVMALAWSAWPPVAVLPADAAGLRLLLGAAAGTAVYTLALALIDRALVKDVMAVLAVALARRSKKAMQPPA